MGTLVELPYSHSQLQVELPQANLLGIYTATDRAEMREETDILRQALAHPIASPPLRELVKPGQKVVIVTSDLTRPCPSPRMLPPVLAELTAAGVAAGDVTVVAALGLHRPMTDIELQQMVGVDLYRRLKVINHDPADTVHVGITGRGTPVQIFRPIVEAQVRICLGNLEFHYFAGYSGGAKAILPGCASKETVRTNHAMMIQPGAATGRIADNPVRADLEEGVALVGVDFILNVVVDSQHRIVEAVAGDMIAAHRRGCELIKARGAVAIPRLADIVLVGAGGYPKDINMYQAQKALDNAVQAVRPGGVIILAAECREGLGNQTFEAWMTAATSPDEILTRIQQEFVLGGHKAAAVAMALKRADIYLVSALPPDLMQSIGFQPFTKVDEALQAALNKVGTKAQVAVLPAGGSVLPLVGDKVSERL